MEIGALEGVGVDLKAAGGGERDAATEMIEGAGERGETDDGLDGAATAFAALDAVVDANDGGLGAGIFAGEVHDVAGRDASELGDLGRRVVGHQLPQAVEAGGVMLDVIGVMPVFADDDVHQAEG